MALLAAEAFAARTGRVVPSRVSDLHRPTQTCNFPFLQPSAIKQITVLCDDGEDSSHTPFSSVLQYLQHKVFFQNLNGSSISAPLSAKQQKEIQQLCAKRLQRMPVQYVLGEWDFQDLTLKMKPPVFIPRPETEELVSLILDEERRKRLASACSKDFPETHGPVILEVGCGSGAIGLSLLKKLPNSQLIAIDKLEAAVNLTKENAERLHLQERIHIFHHDITSCPWVCLQPWGLVDTIISNPPYIFHEDMSDLAAEILCFEDLGALDGGIDGMSIIKEILAMASYILKDCGSVYLEVDPRHPKMVTNWLSSHPDLFLFVSATHKDFYGKPRFLHIQKRRKEDHQEL